MKNVNFKLPIIQALNLTKDNYWLWLLGLFFSGFGSYNIFNYSLGTPSANKQEIVLENINSLVSRPGLLAVAIAVLILVLIVFLYISAVAKAGVISAALKIPEKKITNIRQAIKSGSLFAWPVIGISLLALLAHLISLIILSLPAVYFGVNGYWKSMVIFIFLGLLIYLFIFISVSFTVIFANNFLVLLKINLKKSILTGFDLFINNWRSSIIFAVFLAILNLLAMISFVILVFLAAVPFFILSFVLYEIGYFMALTIVLSLAIMAIMILFIVFSGALSSWQKIAWVYFWQQLITPIELEEKVKATVPVSMTG